jgi:ABC-2 type transport system permease protein
MIFKLLAFIKRDFLISVSYRMQVALELGGTVLYLMMFYFISKTFGGAISPYLARYGSEYFPYVVVGLAVSSFVTVGLSALSGQIRAAQVEGTLEALLSTPTSVYTVLMGNSLWKLSTAFFYAIFMIASVFLITGLKVVFVRALASLFILLLTLMDFLAIGMLSASFVMIFKQGNPIDYIFGWSSFFLGGILYPVEVLPKAFHFLSRLLPITYAVKAIRELLLTQESIYIIAPLFLSLSLFAVVLGPLSLIFFRYALERAKRDGNLIQF